MNTKLSLRISGDQARHPAFESALLQQIPTRHPAHRMRVEAKSLQIEHHYILSAVTISSLPHAWRTFEYNLGSGDGAMNGGSVPPCRSSYCFLLSAARICAMAAVDRIRLQAPSLFDHSLFSRPCSPATETVWNPWPMTWLVA
jgi:hypothetical protein